MFDGGRLRIASVVATAGWLIAGATAPVGGAGAVTLTADAGLDGTTRPGRLTRVRIALENSDQEIAGTLVVVAGTTRVTRALNLPGPSRKRIELQIRVPSADIDRIRVAFVAAGREVSAVDAAVRFAPEETPFVLCEASSHVGGSDTRCTSSLDAPSLPDSWRGYDAVDKLVLSPVAALSLTASQRIAIKRWSLLRRIDLSAGLAAEPSGPGRFLTPMRMLIAAYAALFLLVVSGTRVLGRRSLSIYAALISIVACGSAAALAQGRIGPGAAVVITGPTIVRSAEDIADSLVSTRGVAKFPAFGSFELSPALDDGVVTMRGEPGIGTFAEDGESILAGVFGKNQRVEFDLEGFSGLPTVTVTRSGETTRIANMASTELTECELPSGLSPRRVALLRPGESLDVRGSPDAEDSALTCRFQVAPPTLQSRRGRVEHQGSAVLVYGLGRFGDQGP